MYENSIPRGETSAQPGRVKPASGPPAENGVGERAPVAAANALHRRGLEISYRMLRGALILSQHHQGEPAPGDSLKHHLSLTLASVPKVGPVLPQALKTAGGSADSFWWSVPGQSHCLSWVSAGAGSRTVNGCSGYLNGDLRKHYREIGK